MLSAMPFTPVVLTEAARPNGSKAEWKDPETLSTNHAASGEFYPFARYNQVPAAAGTSVAYRGGTKTIVG